MVLPWICSCIGQERSYKRNNFSHALQYPLLHLAICDLNNMKWFIVAGFLAVAVLAAEDQYTDRYDNLNIEEILANRRLLLPYLKCILDQGRCTPEGKALKTHIKDGMQTACSKCTEWQKTNARKVVKHIKEKEKEYWEQLKKKFDPDDAYKPIYEPFLAVED